MRTRTSRFSGPARDVQFSLAFPRESLTIPFMRHVLGDALSRLGVEEGCVSDLLLAVTEACANVLRHAGPGRRYEVVVRVGRNRCLLQVLDDGPGFGPAFAAPRLRRRGQPRGQFRRPPVRASSLLRRWDRRAAVTDVASLPESGRGLEIMRACVDDVSLRTERGRGTVVSLRKRIEWRDQESPFSGRGAGLARLGHREPALRSAG